MNFLIYCNMILISIISLWAPLSVDSARVSAVYLYLPVGFALIASPFFYRRFSPLIHADEAIALVSISAGLTYGAINTEIPRNLLDNYPPLETFFLGSYLLLLVFIAISVLKRWRSDHAALMFTLWTSNLLYTQVLDKSPFLMVMPLLSAIVCLTAHIRIMTMKKIRIGFPKSIKMPLIAISIIIASGFRDWFIQGATFYADMSVILTSMIVFWITVRLLAESTDLFLKLWKIFIPMISIFIIIHAIWKTAWVSVSYGFMSTPNFELWIALIHPNALGVFLAAVIPVLWTLSIENRRYRHFYWILMGLLFILLIGTYSRGAWLSLFFGCVLGYLILGKQEVRLRHKEVSRRWFLASAIAALLISLVAVNIVAYRIFSTESIVQRLSLWSAAVSSMKSEPVWGAGIGRHERAAAFFTNPFDNRREFLEQWFYWDRLGRHFHNSLFEIGFTLGISGLMAFGWLLLILFKKTITSGGSSPIFIKGMVAAFFVVFFSGLLDFVFYYPALMISSAVFIAGALSAQVVVQRDISQLTTFRRIRNCALPLLSSLVLIFFVFTPIAGQHWMKRAQSKTGKEIWWALEAYKKAALYRPWDRDIYRQMIPICISVNQRDLAGKSLQRMLEHRPYDPQIQTISGWASSNSFERITNISQAVALDPCGYIDDEHYSDLGLSLFILNDFFKGTEYLKKSFLVDPRTAGLLTRFFPRVEGGILLRPESLREYLKNRFKADYFGDFSFQEIRVPVEELLEKIEDEIESDQCPEDREQRKKRLIQARLYNNNKEDGIRLMNAWNIRIDQLIEREEQISTYKVGSPDYAIIQANRKLRDQRYDEAEQLYRYALDENLDNAQLRFGLGLIYTHRQKWELALREFEKACEMMPDLSEIHANMGFIHEKTGNIDAAVKSYEKALELNPLSIQSLRFLGIKELENQQYESAFRLLNRAVRISPDDAQIAYRRILAMENMEARKQQAPREWENFRRKFPDFSGIDRTPDRADTHSKSDE